MKILKIITSSIFFLFICLHGRLSHAEQNNNICSAALAKANVQYKTNNNYYSNGIFVVSSKGSFFYNAPDNNCIINNLFIIANDQVYVYKTYDEFAYIGFFNDKGRLFTGWVKQDTLNKLSMEFMPTSKKLNLSDFLIKNKDGILGVNFLWTSAEKSIKQEELSNSYIGDFPNNSGGLYKYNQHDYSSFSIISSNYGYDEKQLDIDDEYIISSITLESDDYQTIRGVKVGDAMNTILEKYNNIPYKKTSNSIEYTFGNMILDFEIENSKIKSISINIGDYKMVK
ncbi:hypothetical protein ABG299_004533 [Salmonella enterica subsp. enterica]